MRKRQYPKTKRREGKPYFDRLEKRFRDRELSSDFRKEPTVITRKALVYTHRGASIRSHDGILPTQERNEKD